MELRPPADPRADLKPPTLPSGAAWPPDHRPRQGRARVAGEADRAQLECWYREFHRAVGGPPGMYAGAVTAHVSAVARAEGADEVLLFTDLANATSSALYRRIGYRGCGIS